MSHYLLPALLALLFCTATVQAQVSNALAESPEVKYIPGQQPNLKHQPVATNLLKWRSKGKLRNASRPTLIPKKNSPLILKAGTDGPILWGNIIGQASWETLDPAAYPFGVYQFRATDPISIEAMAKHENLDATGGGAFFDGVFHFISYSTIQGAGTFVQYFEYDTSNWEMIRSTSIDDPALIAVASTWDPNTKRLYGSFFDSEMTGYNFGYLTFDNMEKKVIKTQTSNYWAMAVDNNGTLYAINGSGQLLKVDKETGEETKVGSTGLYPSFQQSMAFDPKTNKLYWAASFYSNPSALYEVNTSTGTVAKIADFPDDEQIVCLYVPENENTDGIPAKVTDLTADFPKGATKGTLSFTIPQNSSLGEPLPDADVSYTLKVSGQTKTGTGHPNQKISHEFTLEEGTNTAEVSTKTEAGNSPSTQIKFYVGIDKPLSPKNLTMDFDESTGKVKLNWERPESGVNGGYIDYENMVYNVYRSGSIVSKGQKETIYEDQIDLNGKLDYYYYEVTAKNNAEQTTPNSDRASTKDIVAGTPLEPDWKAVFNSNGEFRLWTILDANNDGHTWEYMKNGNTRLARAMGSETVDSDDWLFSPPFHLKADRFYKVRYKARPGLAGRYDETFSFSMGQRRTAEGMTTKLQESTTLPQTSTLTAFEHDIRVESDGVYYFGFHAESAAGNFAVYIDDVEVLNGVTFDAPDTVTDLNVTAGAEGSYEANVSFKAPTKNIRGEQISSISKIEVWKGSENIPYKTFDNPTPGETYSFVDTEVDNGEVTYAIAATNEAGTGMRLNGTVWVGYDAPQAPKNIILTDNLDGTLALSWEMPGKEGVHGGFVENNELIYNIYDVNIDTGETTLREENISSTSATLKGLNLEGNQDLLYFAVSAISDMGEGDMGLSSVIIKGTPYTLPYSESFANGTLKRNDFWWVETSGPDTPDWGATNEISADNDNGCSVWLASGKNQWASFNSGKIALKEAQNPQLMFNYFAVPGKDVLLSVTGIPAGGEEEEVEQIYYKNLKQNGWQLTTVDLNAVKDAPYTILKFKATSNDVTVPVALDNIIIMDMFEHNLSASIACPSLGKINETANITVTVTSLGSQTANDYTVDLYFGKKLVASEKGTELKLFENKEYQFTYEPTIEDVGTSKVYAVVNFAADGDPSNNTTEAVEMKVNEPELPAITTLTAETKGSDAYLSWTKPERDERVIVEDFESYKAWEIDNAGEWTIYDNDKMVTTGMMGFDFPNLGKPHGYIVFKPTDTYLGKVPRFLAHSGEQYMASWAAYSENEEVPSKNDDWLISPELVGDAQTISLWAKGASLTYTPESFEICYSTTGNEPADFKVLKTYHPGADYWTEYTADLPEGTYYFAIHCISEGKLALFVDDITYTNGKLTVEKYNIYRDGKQIDSVGPEITEYTDTGALGENHVYNVTTVYNYGESVFSNNAATASSILADATQAGILAKEGILYITATNGLGVRVFTMSGALLYSGTPGQELQLPLTSGQYLVTIGNATYNILMK